MKKWLVIIILALAQFVMILDSTVMNVSISVVAKDLHTTISGMQAAITFYALTMAALMLTGGKLGDIWGRHRAFRVGSVIYGIGSFLTAISPSLVVLLFGWSFIEGIGAILVIPAIAALAAINYQGRQRIAAFSLLGAATGLAAAVGPLIGGIVTTYFSWRYVFAGETVVMAGVLLLSNRIRDEKVSQSVSLDYKSSILSAVGMALLVFGILQSKTWGWISPLKSPMINGREIAPFGISLVAYLILAGVLVLWWFIERQRKLEKTGKHPLLRVSMLRIPVLRSGLNVLLSQYFTIAALFFVIPVYLQINLGLDALETGFKLIPLSIGLLIFSIVGSRMSLSRSSRRISRIGQLALALGTLTVVAGINTELNGVVFWIGMFVIGSGFGLLASQINNVNMSAVSADETSEVGGLQGTFQNLGTSMGTAVVGSFFILLLTSGFNSSVQSSASLTLSQKNAIATETQDGVQIVTKADAEQAVIQKGGSSTTARTVGNLYVKAQVDAIKAAMFIVFIISVLSLIFSRNLPRQVSAKDG